VKRCIKIVRKSLVLQTFTLGVLSVCLVASASLAGALLEDNDLDTKAKVAEWARSWNLGILVDTAEHIVYRDPPSGSADELSTENSAMSPASSLPDTPSTSPTITTPTTTPPAPLEVRVQPSLKDEGVWTPVRSAASGVVVWTAGLRPSAKLPAVSASFALIDQTALTARLHNGTEVPGGTWQAGNSIPEVDRSATVFAFNGGFLKKHSMGGYYTEGREVWPLQHNRASLAIDSNGRVHIGEWGTQLSPDGWGGAPWVSVRQNLTMLVKNGAVFNSKDTLRWGWSGKGELYILRSAVCERYDDRLLYAIVGKTDAVLLAKTMRNAGCKNAMQLDVNAAYPRGYVFTDGVPRRIDRRQTGSDNVYLSGSYREFIALSER
jgi:hypothetical protein